MMQSLESQRAGTVRDSAGALVELLARAVIFGAVSGLGCAGRGGAACQPLRQHFT